MGKQSKAQEAEARRKYMDELRRKEAEKQKQQNRMMWQIVIAVLAIVIIAATVSLAISLSNKGGAKMEDLDLTEKDISLFKESKRVTEYVKMNVSYTDQDGVTQTGDVIIRLFPEVAPETVKNFQNLVKSDFYNGLTFHRIVEGFMIQGGDPDGNGKGGSATTIHGEFTSNGFVNNLKHNRGVISMARSSPDSASSQFFIVHEESANNHLSLDGKYASFGIVVYGMDTVDAIAATEVETDPTSGEKSVPVNPVTINDISFVKLA